MPRKKRSKVKQYDVEVKWIGLFTVTVEAGSEQEAMDIVSEDFDPEDHTADDIGVTIEAATLVED